MWLAMNPASARTRMVSVKRTMPADHKVARIMHVQNDNNYHRSNSPATTPQRNGLNRGMKQKLQWLFFVSLVVAGGNAAEDSEHSNVTDQRLPLRVHVFEDYETEIEQRWWLRGNPVTDQVPPSLSTSVPNRRACQATETKDFDDLMGDPAKTFKAVIFNPVPGPPMGKETRLAFRCRLVGTDKLRVQIYSLTNNYHRRLELSGLKQEQWESFVVDMTQARRPDGSGGPLSEDERIDDIQFYVDSTADLWIDDIVLYESAAETQQPFPRRIIFTGWFDTGEQGK